MGTPLFEFAVDGLKKKLRVARFSGHERLSELYHFEVLFVCDDADLPFSSLVGKKASLKFHEGDDQRFVHGVICDAEQGSAGKRVASYRVSVVPELWRLLQRQDCRIFQAKTAPDIIDSILTGAALDACQVKKQLQGSYRTRDYCVQYRETDWAFVSRLMEEEGIFYFFEHEEDKHTLVLADAPAAHAPIVGDATIPFREPAGALATTEHISIFRYREGIRPDKVALRDYNFHKPDLGLHVESAGADDPALEIYDYPGNYDAPGDGTALTKVGLERWRAQRKLAWGESRVMRLTSGQLFTMAEHPRGDFNRKFLIVQVEHEGSQPLMAEASGAEQQGYENRFSCMPDDVPFRPTRRTPRPSLNGIQTAVVTGPAGEEVHTDEHGRIKVQFHWDREGKKDEHSSCWVRVAQPWAGASWGALFLPRIGHEVVVSFLEGDPDRPLVTGSVYHATNVPPYPLPDEKTKSTIKSNTSKGGGGSNELRFEDKKGNEEIYLHAQKDWNTIVENDRTQQVLHDEKMSVGNDRLREVKRDEKLSITRDQLADVGRDRTEKVGRHESVDIGGNETRTVGGDQNVSIDKTSTITIQKELTAKVGGDADVGVDKGATINVGGAAQLTIGKDETASIGGKLDLTVGKEMSESIGKSYKGSIADDAQLTVGKKYRLEVGEGSITVEKNGNVTVAGKDISITGSGKINIKSGGKLTVAVDGACSVEASGAVKVKGSNVGLN